MWGGNLIEVVLLGWLIEGVHNEVALRTLYPVAAAALEAAVLEAAALEAVALEAAALEAAALEAA